MSLDINAMTPAALRLEVQRRIERRAKGLPLTEEAPGTIRQRHSKQSRPALESAKIEASRHEWRITLYGPPRTKKNHIEYFGKQSAAYRKWCADVVDQIGESDFAGPIPDAPYNLRADFYVDRYGQNADLIGLLQGLADALEAAKVVTNDKLFRGFDGSRAHADYDGDPRVEIVLSPLSPSGHKEKEKA